MKNTETSTTASASAQKDQLYFENALGFYLLMKVKGYLQERGGTDRIANSLGGPQALKQLTALADTPSFKVINSAFVSDDLTTDLCINYRYRGKRYDKWGVNGATVRLVQEGDEYRYSIDAIYLDEDIHPTVGDSGWDFYGSLLKDDLIALVESGKQANKANS